MLKINRNNSTLLLAIILCFSATYSKAQELNCQVDINFSQLPGSVNKQIFEQMKRQVYEFMNNTKWTSDNFAPQEKIDCSLLIVVKEAAGTEDFSGTIQVIARRPVFKSSTYSQTLNLEDENFQFKFQQFSQLEYNINTHQNNLTSVLQFYAFVILASDYDTFSPLGGTSYWQKAQIIVNNAQNAPEIGWKSSQSGQRNRYWLVESELQPVFKGIRDCMYEYHIKGLDIMNEKLEIGRANILKALDLLKPVYNARPASFVMQVFFNAKRDELINIFKGATPEEKTKAIEVLTLVDPAGTTKYVKIQG